MMETDLCQEVVKGDSDVVDFEGADMQVSRFQQLGKSITASKRKQLYK